MTNPNPYVRKNIKPGLTVPGNLDPEMTKFLQGVKEHLQGADGTRGQPLERFVTLQDLETVGLISTGVLNGRGIIKQLLVQTNEAAEEAAENVYDEFSELTDVAVSSRADLDGIRFNAGLDKWVATDQIAMLDRDPQTWTAAQIFDQSHQDIALLVYSDYSAASKQANIASITYGVSGGGTFHANHANGTHDVPTPTLALDITGGIGSRAYHDGGAFHTSSPASIHWQATEDQTTTGYGMWIRFLTTPKASTTRAERGGITDNGTMWIHDGATYSAIDSAQTLPIADAAFVASGGGTKGAAFVAVTYDASSYTAGFRGMTSRGTPASPTVPQANDLLAFLGGHGYDGSAFTTGAKALIGLYAAETFSGSAQGTYVTIATTALTTTTRSAVALFSNAEIQFDTTLLDINATVDVSGIATFNSRVDAVGGVRATATVPFFELLETDAAANNQKWFAYAQAAAFALSAATDLEAHTNFMTVFRSGATVTEIQFDTTLIDVNVTNFELEASTIALTDAALPFLTMNTTTPALVAGGANGNSAFWMLQRYNAALGGPDIGFYHSRGATVGSHTILVNGDEIGSLSFYASDGTSTPVKVARIIGLINGTVGGATDLPSRIAIYATPDGSATLQQVASFSPDTTTIAATTLTLSAAVVVDVVGSASTGLFMSSSVPVLGWYETDAGSNEKRWLMYCNAGGFSFETRTDDGSSSVSIFSVSRSGTTVSNATFPNRVIFSDASGNGKPSIDIASANPTLHWRETDASADNGIWYANVRTEAFTMGLLNDANTANNIWCEVQRTGASIDSITIYTGATVSALQVDTSATAGNTRLLVYDVDNAALERVTVGAADSGGAGYKVLRIPN